MLGIVVCIIFQVLLKLFVLYFKCFRSSFSPGSTLDGFLGIQFSEVISYILAYHVNIDFDGEGHESTVTKTGLAWKPFPLVQANTEVLSLSSGIYAEEEWTERGIADTVTILISYLVAYVCITLGDKSMFILFFNLLLLNALLHKPWAEGVNIVNVAMNSQTNTLTNAVGLFGNGQE